MSHYPEDELQRQTDIGAEINERELHGATDDAQVEAFYDRLYGIPETPEPDDQGLVGALVAQCGYLIGDLVTVNNTALLVDQSREDLAATIRDLDKMLQLIGTVRDEVAQALAHLMEDDHEAIAGFAVARSRSMKTEWDRDGTWRAMRFAIVERWGFGEMVDRVLADVKTAHNAMTPSVNGLKALQIDPNEFRATTRAERYSVTVK